MNESLMPDRGSGGNKMVLFLLVGGTILMAAAGLVIYLRRTPTAPPKEAAVEAPAEVKTLVVPTRPRPLIAETDTAKTDTDTAAEPADNGDKKNKKKQMVEGATGTIDTKAVNSIINNNFSQVKACYERRLKMNSFLEGKLDLNIVVSTSGKVVAVTVNSDSVRDAEMLSCVKNTIRSWEFPKPEGGRVIIGKTFNFKKKDR